MQQSAQIGRLTSLCDQITSPHRRLRQANSDTVPDGTKMKAMPALRGDRWAGGLLATGIACLLFVQALMTSVGLGMAAEASGPGDALIVCSASDPSPKALATNDDRRKPSQSSHCPFCYIAAQSAGQIATIGHTPFFPAHVAFESADVNYARFIDQIFVLPLRRRISDPRAPPKLPV
ncbi:MAG: DUF2946 family protein [Beijerinckiaceae bacterium]